MSEQDNEQEQAPDVDPGQQEPQEQIGFEQAMAAEKAIKWHDLKEHLAGPVLSLAAHVLLFAVCLTFAVGSTVPTSKDVEVTVTEMEVKAFEPPPEPPPPEEDVEISEVEVEVDRPSAYTVETPSTAVTAAVGGVADVATESAGGTDVDMPNVLSVRPSTSSVVMPGIYANRGVKGRGSATTKFGGAGTSNPVLKALRWLKANQNENGSWCKTGGDRMTALTGFALMCYLAHGETPQSVEFGPSVQNAIKFLSAYMEKPNGGGYGHAIGTYAVSEAYGMTQIPLLKSGMANGVSRIVKGMNSVGGFTYAYGTDGRSDLSVAAWNYQALKAAYAAGCDAPGLEEAIIKAIKCLKTVSYVPTGKGVGGFAYAVTPDAKAAPGSCAMTGAGTLSLQLLGEGGSPEATGGFNNIAQNIGPGKFWVSYGKDGAGGGLYGWYYQTQAIFQSTSGSGQVWEKWNKQMKRGLISAQSEDGHWNTPDCEGHTGMRGEGVKVQPLDEQIYATCLACLCLEVYYRFLPTFKGTGGLAGMKGDHGAGAKKDAKPAAGAKKDKEGEEDLGLKIL